MTTDAYLSNKQRCLALTRDGAPCRNWAVHGSRERYGQPLCRAHSPDPDAPDSDIVPWQLYAPYFTAEECAALEELLEALAGEHALTGEILTARIMLRRLLAHIARLGDLTTDDLVRLHPLVLATLSTISRLLKDKQALQPEGEDAILKAMAVALDNLSEQWGIEL